VVAVQKANASWLDDVYEAAGEKPPLKGPRKGGSSLDAIFERLESNADVDASENLFLARKEFGYNGDPKEFRFSEIYAREHPRAKRDRFNELLDEAQQRKEITDAQASKLRARLSQDQLDGSGEHLRALDGLQGPRKKKASPERKALEAKLQQLYAYLGYAGHTPETVDKLHAQIAEVQAKLGTLAGPKVDIAKLVEDRDAWPDLAEIRKRQPRPLHKLYGKNPTPEQIAASKAEHRAWNSEYRKAQKLYKALVEESNRRFHKRRLTCSNCDGPLTMEDPAYGLVCPKCNVRVAGPFETADEVPDYVSAYERPKPLGAPRDEEKKLPKDIEAALHAARLYIGKGLTMRISDEQKLYRRMNQKIAAVAKRRGMDEAEAYRQIMDKAKAMGGITPMPGKDI
jgi:hypothetical protein